MENAGKEVMKRDFERGDQIAYIPSHAEGDIRHKDVEFGFVTSVNEMTVFCRYWNKYCPGLLRTTANSEATPRSCLIRKINRPQKVINVLLVDI